MASFKRCIVVAWIGFGAAVLLTSAVIALLVRFVQLNGRTYLAGAGDQTPIYSGLLGGQSFSRYYCQGLEVSVDDASGDGVVFNAYALAAPPVLTGSPRRQLVKTTTAIGPTGVSPPFAFSLHRGPKAVSWMKIHACSNKTALTLYRCQDEAAALAWHANGDNQRCGVMCEYSQCGDGKENYCSFLADDAHEVDEFVMMLSAPEIVPSDDKIQVDAVITRYPYDLRVHSAVCLNATLCELPVVMAETEAVVLEIPSRVTTSSIVLKTECQPRVGIYFAFCLGLPVAVILAGSLLVFLPCILLHRSLKKQSFELQVKGLSDAQRASTPREHDRAGLVENEHLDNDWHLEQ